MAIIQLNLLLCFLTTLELAFAGTPKQNRSAVEEVVSNRNGFRDICVDLSSFNAECRYKHCDTTEQFREIDGCCNNIGYPAKGVPNTPFRRLLSPDYSDRISLPRGGLTSSSLPSPRAVSVAVHQSHDETNHKESISQMVMQFGQFLDHDISLISEHELHCCDTDVAKKDSQKPQEQRTCFNIDISNDVFYKNKMQCFPFTRSDGTCTNYGRREQFNTLTAFIDGSMIYGSDKARSDKLRTMSGGLLKTHKLGPTLPSNSQVGFVDQEQCNEDLVAGDVRAHEQPGLSAIHSLFLLEHNRLATEFKTVDLTLTDEELFQKARQIVSAEIQQVAYSEFLPVVLGKHTMDMYHLNLPSTPAGTTKYNSGVDPTVFNEFATFAFRFGHSLVPNLFKTSTKPEDLASNICILKDNFFRSEECVFGPDFSGKAWKNLILGLSQSQAPKMDARMEHSLTNFLFCEDNCDLRKGFGQDLAARNIQRGRDHGLPGYVRFRAFCGLSVPSSWNDKPEDISQKNWDNMKSVYTNVADIDVFTGAMSEKSVSGGLVGATIACVLGKQFKDLMAGDRFFFTHPSEGSSNEKGLPSGLRNYLSKRKLSNILCDNIQDESISVNIDAMDINSVATACSQIRQSSKLLEPVVLITGGADGDDRFSSEIYNPFTKTSCSLPQLPEARGGHSQNAGLICAGGYKAPASRTTCVKWNPASGTWKKSHTLKEGRNHHVSWATESGVYLIGGNSANTKLTSVKVNNDGSVEQSFSLKYDVDGSCAIPDSDNNEVIITGGIPTMTKVAVYSEAGWQRDLADLNRGRHVHACTSYVNQGKKVLLVTGGQPTTEIYQDGAWRFVSDLPLSRHVWGASAITLNNRVLHFGGRTGQDLNNIFEFNKETEAWTEIGSLMETRRHHRLTIVSYDDYAKWCK